MRVEMRQLPVLMWFHTYSECVLVEHYCQWSVMSMFMAEKAPVEVQEFAAVM